MLPQVQPSSLDLKPIDWTGLPRRFMNPGELEVLVALVRSVAPRHVIEFGVNVGRTAKAILAHVPSVEKYTGIDVPVGYVPTKKVQRNEVPKQPGELVLGDPRFELIVRRMGSLELTPADLEPAGAVFIDGDHSSIGVIHDTALARSLVKPPGIIVWHDYHDEGTVDVKMVLDSLWRDGHDLHHVAGTWIAFERVL